MPVPIEQINSTTWRAPIGDDYAEFGNLDAPTFEPHILLPKWNRERQVKVMPHGIMAGEVEIEVEEDKVKSKYKFEIGGVEEEIETEFYVMPPTEQFERGIAELDIVLPRRPNDNRIILDIEAEGVDFWHQPPLTPEEIAEEAVRPDNIVNSYALYDKVKRDHAIGGINYKCGKLFHIPRPRPIDAIGNWCWADLLIENGRQIITIPWDFLNNAVYPIRHIAGDTFGDTDGAGTGISIELITKGSWWTCPAAGSATMVSVQTEQTLAFHEVKCAVYAYVADNDAGALLRETEKKDLLHLKAYDDFNLAAPLAVAAATKYFLMGWGESAAGNNWMWYDAGAAKGITKDLFADPNGFPNPMAGEAGVNRAFAIYCTYAPTVAGGGGAGGLAAAAGVLLT